MQQSNEDLQQFAYAASHDLQEPLRAISSFSQLLSRKQGTHLDKDSQQFIHFILDSAERMGALIRDLLDFLSIASDQATPLSRLIVMLSSNLLSITSN